MIVGIGIDIVNMARIKRMIERWGRRFIERIFTKKEEEYAFSKRYPYIHLSGRFAVKEALFKALGGGLISGRWKEVEIINDKSGSPRIRFYGNRKRLIIERGITSAHVSISHDYSYSIGQVILEKSEAQMSNFK